MSAVMDSSHGSDESLHNGPTSIWIPAEGSSTVSSPTRPMEEGISTLDSSRRTSSLTGWTNYDQSEENHRASFSSDSDLQFSKRLSDVSDEGKLKIMKPASFFESARKSKRILPISSLRFSSLGLVGRDDEKELLVSCLKRAARGDESKTDSQGSRELVLISGAAGTGKTALAAALAKPVRKLEGLYVKGKFDIYLRGEPYAGMAAAFREICGRILLLRDGRSFEMIRQELIDKVGSENLHLLINVIPELSEIVGDDGTMDDIKSQGGELSKARFNYAFRLLVRVVASHFAPLVILLDDLQWADAATLDLIQVLIADRDNPSLMVIGAYRSNEVDEHHPLSALINEMKRTSEQDDFDLTEIEIGNMDTSQVNEVLLCLLNMDEPMETLALADVCHKRSLGNIFSLLVFLQMLQAEGHLHYNLGTFKWCWDEQKIMSETAATANVVDLMKQKIGKLPADVGERLTIAACLGFSFEPAILFSVWDIISRQKGNDTVNKVDGDKEKDKNADGDKENKNAEGDEDDENKAWLALVEQEGFLEVEPDGTAYRWVHDKVQEAATSIVPPDELRGLKAQVGTILMDELDEKDMDSYIFTVVNLLHEGGIPDEETEGIKLAELCLQASKKAANLSAFESTSKFATIGVNVLPTNMWSDHYDLTLNLYSTAAEAACYLGKTEELEKYCNEVLDQKDRPLFDKLRVYHAMISYLGGASGRPNDATDLIVDILAQFGIKFPKRKSTRLLATISGAFKAKRAISALQPEDITIMPTMNDPEQLEIMRLLDQLFIAAYLAKSDLLPLSIFASARLTLDYGLSEYSAPVFAGLALILGAALGDMALAAKTGNFAELAMSKVECKNMDARTDLWLTSFVLCWTNPITRMFPRLLKAYETGLSVGDNENACWCIAQYIVIGFMSGKPLGTVRADCKIYVEQMKEFKREVVHADICIYLEMIQNLMGLSDGDPTTMENEQRFLSHKDHTVLGVFYSCQCILYLYFGECEKGAKLAIERDDTYSKGVPMHVWIMMETFTRGMCLYIMARKSKKRAYKKHAQKVHKTIKSWIRKGNPNVKHYDLMLKAEAAALDGKLDAAEGWYQSAVVSATRRGHVHESALVSERYGEFLLNDRNDPEEARHKFDDAIRRYGEWGAAKKVRMLREKHEDVWTRPSEVVLQLGRSRRR